MIHMVLYTDRPTTHMIYVFKYSSNDLDFIGIIHEMLNIYFDMQKMIFGG